MSKPLIAALATAALATACAPPASAATFKGSCEVTGIARFDTPLKGEPAPNGYDFRSGSPDGVKPDGTNCDGTLNGQPIQDVPASATVRGIGQLSCAASTSTQAGSGFLVIGSSVFPFAFEFKGATTEVAFVAGYQGGSSPGHASFARYVTPDQAVQTCDGPGFSQLGFDATLADGGNTIQGHPIPAPATSLGPGYTPSASSAPGSSGTGSTPRRKAAPCAKLERRKRAACVRRHACTKKKGRKRARCRSALNRQPPARRGVRRR